MDDKPSSFMLPTVSDQTQQADTVITAPQVQANVQDDSVAPSQAIVVDSGLSAQDVDLIEKAWVEKAKLIVRSTHGDPYAQNKELSKIKAEYVKKRYNKDLRVVE